jgi:predicted nucleic acid-binding Zn ribbon protein
VITHLTCEHCGQAISASATFCKECGQLRKGKLNPKVKILVLVAAGLMLLVGLFSTMIPIVGLIGELLFLIGVGLIIVVQTTPRFVRPLAITGLVVAGLYLVGLVIIGASILLEHGRFLSDFRRGAPVLGAMFMPIFCIAAAVSIIVILLRSIKLSKR